MSSNLPPGMEEGDQHFYPAELDCACGHPREDHEDDGPCKICGAQDCPAYNPEDYGGPEGW